MSIPIIFILIKQEQGTSVTLEMIRLPDKKFDRQQCVVFMFYISKSLNLAFNIVLLTFYGVKRVKFTFTKFWNVLVGCCNQDVRALVLSIIQSDDTLRLARVFGDYYNPFYHERRQIYSCLQIWNSWHGSFNTICELLEIIWALALVMMRPACSLFYCWSYSNPIITICGRSNTRWWPRFKMWKQCIDTRGEWDKEGEGSEQTAHSRYHIALKLLITASPSAAHVHCAGE